MGWVERTAVVVGGGIGGVTAGVALRRAGRAVTVLERAPAFGEVGAGITVFTNGLRALDVIGVGDAVRAGGVWDTAGGIRDASGRWVTRLAASDLAGALGVHRATLHRAIRERLERDGAALVAGAEVTAVRDGAVSYVRDGAEQVAEADLVVGADGLRSTVRERLWPAGPRPRHIGSTAWRGVTPPWPEPIAITTSWGVGQEFGAIPLGDGRVYWYVAENAAEGARHPSEWDYLRERYAAWHAPLPALVAATDPAAVLRHDIHELSGPLPTYVRGAVALVGDAAHAMAPTLGQGAALAMEDAVVLAACLPPGTDLAAGPARSDALRRPRTQAAARAARITARIGLQLENPLAVGLRNRLMRFLPPRAAVRGITRFADWAPPTVP
ncbi:hypothetical protein BJF78_02795 [Pseudonocardia sp. CNS-139]|nr:hypothetical protein BJF78_02795 [Pseudonocardia sp. CNS-139]